LAGSPCPSCDLDRSVAPASTWPLGVVRCSEVEPTFFDRDLEVVRIDVFELP
jgi:hypothetical protein